ncbi:hypothetical protein FQN57_007050 [Myotisia sp. PD_48]|nr:hypothetical protein FQN57_007050 [Myotisia sp. PD_48]
MSVFSFNDTKLRPPPVSVLINHSDPFIFIERQSKQVERDLQGLLDAQSRLLASGLPLASHNDTSSSTRSSTPTSSRAKSAVTMPLRQPPEKRLGLRGTRYGILKAMNDLLSLKEEEQHILRSELGARRDALGVVETFMAKRAGLEKSISDIQSDNQQDKVDSLSRALQTLDEEVQELETKLAETKARHRRTAIELAELQNSVDSKLSSYQAALSIVQSDSRRYLKSPPIQPLPNSTSLTTFYALPPDRRTLDMAQEHWSQEMTNLRSRSRSVNREVEALKAGGRLWHNVISTVTAFEKNLRDIMKDLQGNDSGLPPEHHDSSAFSIMKQLDEILEKLGVDHEVAERKNWTLLICCIGAELDAFSRAKKALIIAIGSTDQSHVQKGTKVAESPEDLLQSPNSRTSSLSSKTGPMSETDPEAYHNAESSGKNVDHKSDTDDEPDPAWLLSLYHPIRRKEPEDISLKKRAAIIAHPYAPLGGCFDDPIVEMVGNELLNAGYVVGTLNLRGAGKSKGRTSWTAKPEFGDLISFYGFIVCYVRELSSDVQSLASRYDENAPERIAEIEIVLSGYSYGSMLAMFLPSLEDIVKIFQPTPGKIDPASQIVEVAQNLASKWKNGIRTQTITPHDHPSQEVPAPTFRSSTRNGSEAQIISRSQEDFAKAGHINVSYLLISPILPPVSYLTATALVSKAGLKIDLEGFSIAPADPQKQLATHKSMVICGDRDAFTSVRKLESWWENMIKAPDSRFAWAIIPGCGHFYREGDAETQARTAIRHWLITDLRNPA